MVRTALEAAGWRVEESVGWAKSLWVKRAEGVPAVADVQIAVGKRDYRTVVEATVNPRWRRDFRKVTYWVGSNDGWTFSAEKVAKIVARVQDIAVAIEAKQQAEVERQQWQAAEQARKAEASKPIEAFIAQHGITTGFQPPATTYLQEWGVTAPEQGTPLFRVELASLTEAQMLAVLAVILPEVKS